MVRDTSLCGLGQSAPNPVLTTLRHFRHEFEDHIRAQALPRRRLRGPRALAVRELLPAAHEHPALPAALQGRPARGRVPLGDPRQPAAGLDRPRLPAPVRQPLPPRRDRRGRQHARRAPAHRRRGLPVETASTRWSSGVRGAQARADRPRGRDRRRRPDRPHLRVLPRAARPQRHRLRLAAGGRRHAALRAAGVPAAEERARQGDRADRAAGRQVRVQRQRRRRRHAQRPRPPVRRRLPRDRHLEGGVGLPARHRAHGRHPGAAVPRGRLAQARRCRSARRSS